MTSYITIHTWKQILNIPYTQEFSIITPLDLPTQRIIQSDVDRTRSDILTPAEKINLELLLTYYCKENNISYKQGMNEIMAPFLYLSRSDLPLHLVYTFFKHFVHSVLGNMFVDHDFKPLQAMFMVFRLILRYHEPRISSFLQFNSIAPECYLTSWILTIFATKITDINLIFLLWKEMVLEQDQFFLLFLSVAFLQHYKSELVNCEEIGIPGKLSSIVVKDKESLLGVIEKARKLKRKMPYSCLAALEKLDIYNLEEIEGVIIRLEQQTCLTVMPREVIRRAFPESKVCICQKAQCFWCVDRAQTIPLVLLDCRTQELQDQGSVPNSILLKNEAFYDTDYMLEYPDQFVSMRGLYHFCLMGQHKYKGADFEFKMTGAQSEDIIDNMINNLIQVFLMKGFQYVSVLSGGFERIHHFAKNFKLDLDNHRESTCALCEPVSKKKDFKWSSAGDVNKVTHYDRSIVGFVKEKKVNEREMQGFCTVVFFCKVEKSGKVWECCLKIGEKWVEVVESDGGGESMRGSVGMLKNITIMKKNPLSVCLTFKDLSEGMVLQMKSKEDVKKCVGQISTFYNKSLETGENY